VYIGCVRAVACSVRARAFRRVCEGVKFLRVRAGWGRKARLWEPVLGVELISLVSCA
jgi:hypothetical protein